MFIHFYENGKAIIKYFNICIDFNIDKIPFHTVFTPESLARISTQNIE